MARGFHRSGDRVVGRLTSDEVTVLRELVADVAALVRSEPETNAATARLFPDPHRTDPAIAADVRGLLQDDLREAKLAAGRDLLATLPDDGRLSLDGEAAEQWLTALNDVRLVLGTALGVTEEDDEVDPLYYWLGLLQETLVEALQA